MSNEHCANRMHSTSADRTSRSGAFERRQNRSQSPSESATGAGGIGGRSMHTIRRPVNGTNTSNSQIRRVRKGSSQAAVG